MNIVLTLKNNVTKDEVNKELMDSSNGIMKGIMVNAEGPIISSDLIDESYSSIVDGLSTIVVGENSTLVKVMSGYDNE